MKRDPMKRDVKCILDDARVAEHGDHRTLCGKPIAGLPFPFRQTEVASLSKRIVDFWLCRACAKVLKRSA